MSFAYLVSLDCAPSREVCIFVLGDVPSPRVLQLSSGVMAAPVSVSLVFVGILLAKIHQSLVTENFLLILYAKLFLCNFLCVFCLLLDPA